MADLLAKQDSQVEELGGDDKVDSRVAESSQMMGHTRPTPPGHHTGIWNLFADCFAEMDDADAYCGLPAAVVVWKVVMLVTMVQH